MEFSKADTHMHTTYSDGLMSPEEMVAVIAAETDLSVIAITDHDSAEGAYVARAYAQAHAPHLEVIIGQEVTTGEGDVVGLFIKSTLPVFETAREAINAIHAQGGLAVAVHPFCRIATLNNMKGLGAKIFELPLDAVEVRNGFPTTLPSTLYAHWQNYRHGRPLPELGGSDSHVPYTVGQPYTWFRGRTAADFRRAVERGHVRAGGLCWSPASMLRLLPVLTQRGLPNHQHPQPQQVYVYSDNSR